MWVIIGSDGDIDYTDVYGPFTTEAEANAKYDLLPPDDGDIAYRVEPIQPATALDTIITENDPEDEEEDNTENEEFVVPLASDSADEDNTENEEFIVPVAISKEYLESEQAAEDRLMFGDDVVNMLGSALSSIADASNSHEQRKAANRAIDLMIDMEDMDEDNLNAGGK